MHKFLTFPPKIFDNPVSSVKTITSSSRHPVIRLVFFDSHFVSPLSLATRAPLKMQLSFLFTSALAAALLAAPVLSCQCFKDEDHKEVDAFKTVKACVDAYGKLEEGGVFNCDAHSIQHRLNQFKKDCGGKKYSDCWA